MPSVFISYRRSDTTSGYASWIYERLATAVGAEQVFMDLDSLPLGVDFVEHLERAMSTANVALVLIGPGWLSAADEHGARRLDDPQDLVRVEVAAALRASVRVVPVLIDGATVPEAGQLPEDIRSLSRRQALVFQRQGGAAIRDLVQLVEQAAREHEACAAREQREQQPLAAVPDLGRPDDMAEGVDDAPQAGDAEGQRATRGLPDYDELHIRLTRGRGSRYNVEVTSSCGARGVGQFLAPSQLDIERFRHTIDPRSRRVRGRSRYLEAATKFGGDLFEGLVDTASVREAYTAARRDASRAGRGLRMTLSLGTTPELAGIPWEFLYDRPRFLAQHVNSPVVRFVDLEDPPTPLRVTSPLRILGMISRPKNDELAELNVEDEQAALERRLGRLIDSGRVTLRWLGRATLEALQQEVDHGEDFHVFHYIGPGEYDDDSASSSLILEHQDHRPRRVGGQQLGAVLCDCGSLRLAVLNACEAVQTAAQDPFAGVATSLMEYDVPAVVAMQFAITDDGALTFADEFYGALGVGYAVDAAVTQARRALAAQRDVEWGTPVLFMRIADGRLFDLQTGVASAAPAVTSAAVRSVEHRASAVPRPPAAPAPRPPAEALERGLSIDADPARAVAGDAEPATPLVERGLEEAAAEHEQPVAVAPPAVAEGAERRPVVLRPSPRSAITGGVLAVAAVVAAVVVMSGGENPTRAPVRGLKLVSGPMSVVLPPAWHTVVDGADDGLALTARATAAPSASTGHGRITIGLGPASSHNASMIAARLQSRLPARTRARRVIVRNLAGGLQAYRYDRLSPRGASSSLTVYVSPTSVGVATIACASPTPAATCRQVARGLSVGAAKPFAVGPSSDYAAAVSSSLRSLRRALRRPVTSLRDAATAAGQARAAEAIMKAYRSARSGLTSLKLSPADIDGNTRLLGALMQEVKAYTALVRTARSNGRVAFRRAARDARSAHNSIEAALGALASAGYRELITESVPPWHQVPKLAVAKPKKRAGANVPPTQAPPAIVAPRQPPPTAHPRRPPKQDPNFVP
jgi:hypothetical protein